MDDEEEELEALQRALDVMIGDPNPSYFHNDATKQPKTVDDMIAMFTPAHFRSFFRFTADSAKRVIAVLGVPEVIRCENK